MLAAWKTYGDAILERSCELFHLTASSMIFNRERTKVLMAYHNIFSPGPGPADMPTESRPGW